MKTTKIITYSVLLTILTSLVSCNLNDDDDDFTVIPEVITLKKKIDDTVKYAVIYYAYSNSAMESVEVTTPDSDQPVELISYGGTTTTFYKTPGDEDFSTEEPTSGQYYYTIVSNSGDTINDYDYLYTTSLEIPEITSITFNSDDYSIDVEWESMSGQDSYFVRLLNSEREKIYTGYTISPDSTHYTINTTDSGWEQSPSSGTSYILQLNAVEYEDTDLTDYYYHINAFSYTENEVTWNPQ